MKLSKQSDNKTVIRKIAIHKLSCAFSSFAYIPRVCVLKTKQ
jgi:hypothetical protein